MNIQSSKSKIKTFALALSATLAVTAGTSIVSTSAQAKKFIKPAATGIGFAQSRHSAKRLAVRAWSKAVRRAYGPKYANFFQARSRRVSCDYIGHGRGVYRKRSLRRGGVIGTLGNVRSPWTCTALARPARKLVISVPDYGVKPLATGVGYAYSRAGAKGLSVRAWTNAVSDRYGRRYSSFSRAARKDISCDYIGRKRSYRGKRFHSRGGVYGSAGNVNAPWTCTATGRPRS